MIRRQGRLAVFVPSMQGGGAERSMLNLAGGIARQGYAVDLVLVRAEGAYLDEIPKTVRLVDLGVSRARWSLPGLIRYLRRERPDGMVSAMNYTNILAVWARRLAGVPTRVVLSAQNTFSESLQHKRTRKQGLMLKMIRRFYPWADTISTVSDGVGDDLADVTGIARPRIVTIHNPVITPDLREKMRVPVDHPWFGWDQPPVLLAAGRLVPQKDFPTLIRAFARIRSIRPARLVILGEGPEQPNLERLIVELGLQDDILLHGFAENPYAFMSKTSAFVLSSRWEGLPTVLIEAMCCGVPLVATDCPSGPREILRGGQFGALVPVADVASLAEAMEDALAGRTPPAPAESWRPYELDAVVQQYLHVLTKD